MDDETIRKRYFVKICRRYGSQEHIRSKDLFLLYADKVEKDIYLSRKMVEHFISFFQRDNRKYSKEDLTEYFEFLVAPDLPEGNTLEKFFI